MGHPVIASKFTVLKSGHLALKIFIGGSLLIKPCISEGYADKQPNFS